MKVLKQRANIKNSTPSGCPDGEYFTGCRQNGGRGACHPCTNGPVNAVYTSSGGFEASNCDFHCPLNHYLTTNPNTNLKDCMECSSCEAGKYELQACSSTAHRVYEFPTVCRDCPEGHSTSAPGQSHCAQCGFGYFSSRGETCKTCQPGKYTPKQDSTYCHECEIGTEVNDVKNGCQDCLPGHYRSQSMTKCEKCPIGSAQLLPKQERCELCIGTVARETGLTECAACPLGKVPSYLRYRADGQIQEGSTECLNCPRRGIPAQSETFDWLEDCMWQCKSTFYKDTITSECLTCNIECDTAGHYRPHCTAGQRGLINCLPCANKPREDAVVGVAFRYTDKKIASEINPKPSCGVQCLPGYNKNDNCARCDSIDANAHFTNNGASRCEWRCNDNHRQEGSSCIPCDLIEYPRTIQQEATMLYFGNDGSNNIADFAVCNSAKAKTHAIIREWNESDPQRCGNGVLERDANEECDDGNRRNNDGCSSLCIKEGSFFECSQIGLPCLRNCGFADHATPNLQGLHGYYLLDPTCPGGLRNRDNLEACGATCPGRELEYNECNNENRGCIACTEGSHWFNPITRDCVKCGSVCKSGHYGVSTCHTYTGDYTRNDRTQPQMGCYPCTTENLEGSYIWTGSGDMRIAYSCPYRCAAGHYCNAIIQFTRTCIGRCLPCTTIPDKQKNCMPGSRATTCTLQRDTRCEACPRLPDHAVWSNDPVAPPCTPICIEGVARWQSDLSKCDLCEVNKTCDAGYFPTPCDSSDKTPASLYAPKYCERCTPVLQPGTEAIASQTGDCRSDCILGQFYATSITIQQVTNPKTNEVFELENVNECTQCLPATSCHPGTLYSECTRRQDATCQPCDLQLGNRHLEYYTPTGSYPRCQTRCIAGYALSSVTTENPIAQCVDCSTLCKRAPGFKPAHSCLYPNERSYLPQCVQCNDAVSLKPVEHAHYTTQCIWACDEGYYRDEIDGVLTCTQCTLCVRGHYPVTPMFCTKQNPAMQCNRCTNIPLHGVPVSGQDPSCPYMCEVGYYKVAVNNGRDFICRAYLSVAPNDNETAPGTNEGAQGLPIGGNASQLVQLPLHRPLRSTKRIYADASSLSTQSTLTLLCLSVLFIVFSLEW